MIEKFKNNIVKNSSKYIKNNILFLAFVSSSLLTTILLRIFTVKNIFALSPFLADFIILLILGAIGYLLKPKNTFKYYLVISIIISLMCVINSIYYTNFLSFVSFSLLGTASQVIDVSDAVVENIMEIKDFFYLWQIPFLIFVHYKLEKEVRQNRKKYFINTVLFSLVLLGIFTCTINSTDYSRIKKQWNREYIVMKFGILTYQANDLLKSITPQISPLFGYDRANKDFREYYLKEKEKIPNEYTDIFEGKNVLVIHAESVQNFVINTKMNGLEITPNLNRLASSGLYFSNFYTQESVGTSSDSEFTFSSSLLPASSGTVFVSYWDREYVTIQKLMKEKNYYTFSMHGNKCSFWNRNVVYNEIGYNDFYCGNKDFVIDEVIGLGLSDKSFFKQIIPKLKDIKNNNEHFYGSIIMLTNHTPFTDIERISDFAVDYKYTENGVLKSSPYLEGTKLGSYIKSVHYADEAIGQLMNDLESNGLLDNTVVIIYGDHDNKLKISEYNRYYNYDYLNDSLLDSSNPNYNDFDEYDYEINRKVPFIIWTKESKDNSLLNKEVKGVMGMYDALPTLGNMFGVSSKYALGNDIFSITDNVVVFPNGNFITDKIYYNNQKSDWALIDPNFKVSLNYIEKYRKHADKVVSVSNDIIIYDLIRKTKQNEKILKGVK